MSTYNVYSPKGLDLLLDPNGQTPNEQKLKASGNQTLNVYDRNFKLAQTFKVNLGFDFHVLGIDWTAEGIYSKTLNDILYKNLAYDMTGNTYGQTYGYNWDNRPMFTRVTSGSAFSNIYALYNTSKGYTVNLSLTILNWATVHSMCPTVCRQVPTITSTMALRSSGVQP